MLGEGKKDKKIKLKNQTKNLFGSGLSGLGYGYQSTPDEYEFFGPFILPPPAVGYDLLRGPLAPGSAGDSAYYDLGFRLGFKNLPLVSFSPLTACVQPQSPDYPLYYATLRWYNWMRGCRLDSEYPNCVPLQDHLGRATMFELSGDPVTGEGDIGAMHYPAEDFHFLMSSGPFTMAKGDTQEVVIALVGGLGNDNLSSIVTLRKNDIFTQAAHDNDFRFPNASVNVDFVNTGSEVRIQADCKSLSANSVKVALVKFDGSEVAEAELYDDGAHGDDAPEDSIFGNSISVDPQSEGLFLDLNVRDANGRTTLWPRLVANIPTVGPLDICEEYVASDNLNNDGKPNPGENVRFGFTIQNLSRNDVFELRVVKATEPSEFVYVNAIPSGQLFSLIYNPNDTTSYFSFDIPSEYQDSKFKILFVVTDRLYNSWIDTLTFPIEPFEFVFEFAEVQHLRGKADGNFGIRIIDPQLLKDHLYAIHGVDSIDAEGHIGISVKDSTDGRILLWNHLVPDELGHNVFPTDGFKIVRGSIPDETKVGMKPGDPFSTSDSSQWGWSIPSGERRWTWANANDLGLEGFHGAIGWDEPAHLFSGSAKTLKSSNLRNTLIKFAETDQAGNVLDPNDPNWSFAYRYLRRASSPPARREFAPFITNPDRGYAYQGYAKSVPFSAWDIEADPPRRLMVGHLENNVEYGKVDGKYWPPSSSEMDNVTNGAREWFFIFDVDYSETPDPRLMMEILGTPMPVMWWGTPNRRGDEAFQAGDEFAIFPVHYITSQDLWTFNPTITHVQESPLPFAYALYQNYPNPFNEQTTIRFSIPKDETVTLKVYNVLGQEVITLVQKRLERGFHEVQWQGKNSMNLPVPSGLYFCRMEAPDYAKVKKMLLLK